VPDMPYQSERRSRRIEQSIVSKAADKSRNVSVVLGTVSLILAKTAVPVRL